MTSFHRHLPTRSLLRPVMLFTDGPSIHGNITAPIYVVVEMTAMSSLSTDNRADDISRP